MIVPDGGFGCILADPPWQFETYSGESAVPTLAADPYPVMSMADLSRLPVREWAAEDCALLMWIVGANLLDALALGEAWGFTYKTDAFIWGKIIEPDPRMDFFPPIPEYAVGMGYWTRKQGEICLLFTRGSPKRLSKGVRQFIMSPRREHSRKPDEIYERCEALVGGPYLEMFARQRRPGWEAYGNEVDKFTL